MIDSKAILKEVRENHVRLQGCSRHNFQPEGDQTRLLGRRYRCSACQGTVDASAVHWYERGLRHAGSGS